MLICEFLTIFLAKHMFSLGGSFLEKINDFQVVSKITKINTNVSTIDCANNGPSKIVFGLVHVLRHFWSTVSKMALKVVSICLIWQYFRNVFLAPLKFWGVGTDTLQFSQCAPVTSQLPKLYDKLTVDTQDKFKLWPKKYNFQAVFGHYSLFCVCTEPKQYYSIIINHPIMNQTLLDPIM